MMVKKIYVLFLVFVFSLCMSQNSSGSEDKPVNYKKEMRSFVQSISQYAKGVDSRFIVIPQNGSELLTKTGEPDAFPDLTYIAAIDGIGREDLYYGYAADNFLTPLSETNYMLGFLDIAKDNGLAVLVTDYCSNQSFVDNSYSKNNSRGDISFAADQRDLNDIPSYPSVPYNVNSSDITSLVLAKNFLYLLDSENYASKTDFLNSINGTDYDAVIIDLFYNDAALTKTEVRSLKTKSNGGIRLIIAYMSIGEAEDYRYYWNSSWVHRPPIWMAEENPDWEGNYKVRYWHDDWQKIIYGNNDSYLKKIIDAGFDGVYLDIIDAFEYFED